MELIHVQISGGFEADINPAVLDDMLIIEDLAALDNGDLLKISGIMTKLLGAEGKKLLYEALQTEDGRVPVSAISEALAEIISAIGDSGKK